MKPLIQQRGIRIGSSPIGCEGLVQTSESQGEPNTHLDKFSITIILPATHIYIYMYICVCVDVCVYIL